MVSYITYPNITDMNFSQGPVTTLLNYGGTVTGGLLAPLMLFGIAIVSFLALSQQPKMGRAITASAFLTTLSAFLMMGAGFLDPKWFLFALAYLVVGIYLAAKENPY
jgi:hypothetical protein